VEILIIVQVGCPLSTRDRCRRILIRLSVVVSALIICLVHRHTLLGEPRLSTIPHLWITGHVLAILNRRVQRRRRIILMSVKVVLLWWLKCSYTIETDDRTKIHPISPLSDGCASIRSVLAIFMEVAPLRHGYARSRIMCNVRRCTPRRRHHFGTQLHGLHRLYQSQASNWIHVIHIDPGLTVPTCTLSSIYTSR